MRKDASLKRHGSGDARGRRRRAARLTCVAVGIVLGFLLLPASGRAGEAAKGSLASKIAGIPRLYHLSGEVTAGYRNVDIDGAKEKFREDYDLRSGLRLFSLTVAGTSAQPQKTPVDRVRLELKNVGDEPFTSYRLSLFDRKLFDLRAAFTRSRYFYAVPALFEKGVSGIPRTDDLHDFDFERTNGTVDLVLRPRGLPRVELGYRLYRLNGDSLTTVRMPEGDLFISRAPVRSNTHVAHFGTQFTLFGTNLALTQDLRITDRIRDLRTPTNTAGLNPADRSTLTTFQREQDENVEVPTTRVRIRRKIGDRTELVGSYLFSHGELDITRNTRSVGTSNLAAFDQNRRARESGGATLDTHIADLSLTTQILENLLLDTTYRFNERSQHGDFLEQAAGNLLTIATGDHVRIHSGGSELVFFPHPVLELRTGVRYLHRDALFSVSDLSISTDQVSVVGGIRVRPTRYLDFYGRYENGETDDPYIVPGNDAVPDREIEPRFVNRGAVGTWVSVGKRARVHYELAIESLENDTFNGSFDTLANSLSLELTPIAGLTFLGAYTHRDVNTRAPIFIAPSFTEQISRYRGSEDIFSSTLSYDFTVAGQKFSYAWAVNFVSSDNQLRPRLERVPKARTLFNLERIDAGTSLVYHYHLIEPAIEVRFIDYSEQVLGANDYGALILNFKLTKRFDLPAS